MSEKRNGTGGGYSGKPYGEKKSYGERSYGEKKSYGERSYGEKKSYGERSYGEKKPYGERSYGEKKPYGEKSYGEKTGGSRYSGKRWSDKNTAYGPQGQGDRPAYKKYDKRPEGETYGKPSGYEKRDGYKKFDRRDAQRPAPAAEEPQQQGGADELPFLIIGRNAVREAVKSGRSIDRILVSAEQDGSLREIVNLARDAKLVLREVDRKKLDELCMPFGHGGKTANHQGIVAYAAGMEYCTAADILKHAKEKGEEPFVIVLDGVEDPHNLGSIIRSAECAGAHGVIIGKRRSASVTAAAVKAAAGATSHMRVARVVNVSGTLEELKRAGLWIAGADMGGTPMNAQGLNGALALVIGGEGGGLSKLVRDTCDFLVSIPMYGQINSLNAGVAAAVLMFEKRRQDAAGEPA